MDDAELEAFMRMYADARTKAGVEPLPDDQARAQAQVLMRLLAPAFEVSYRQH